jgi:protein SERAC1
MLLLPQALFVSQQSVDHDFRKIFDSMIAIGFLGTPHFGSDHAHWGKLITYFTNIVKKTNRNIIRVLETESEVLNRIKDDFHNMLRGQEGQTRAMKIICFFEELPYPGLGEASYFRIRHVYF